MARGIAAGGWRGVVLLALLRSGASGASWSYQNQTVWAGQKGSMCGHDSDQSPIDIEQVQAYQWEKKVPDDGQEVQVWLHVKQSDGSSRWVQELSWRYEYALINASLIANRYGWEVAILPPFHNTTSVRLQGRTYSLKTFRFACPSEHWIDGNGFDMEVQFSMEAPDGERLVVSVLMRVGLVPNSTFLDELWDSFPAPDEAPVSRVITTPFFNALPSKDQSFYSFTGSLSQPPCTNGTIWIVFQEPMLISRGQRDRYRRALQALGPQGGLRILPDESTPNGAVEPWNSEIGTNNRRIQPLGARSCALFKQIVEQPNPVQMFTDLWAYVILGVVLVLVLGGAVALVLVARQQQAAKRRKTEETFSDGDGLLDAHSSRSVSEQHAASHELQKREVGAPQSAAHRPDAREVSAVSAGKGGSLQPPGQPFSEPSTSRALSAQQPGSAMHQPPQPGSATLPQGWPRRPAPTQGAPPMGVPPQAGPWGQVAPGGGYSARGPAAAPTGMHAYTLR